MVLVAVLGFVVFWVLALTIKRKINTPSKSLKNCFVSVILIPLRILGIGPFAGGPFTLEKSMINAMKHYKLHDFGENQEAFVGMYNKVLNFESHKKQIFHEIGYITAHKEMDMILGKKLRLVEYIKQNPDVLNVKMRDPVFITGLARSGTTYLFELLAVDKSHRSPRAWELIDPIPKRNGPGGTPEGSVERAARRLKISELLAQRDSIGDSALRYTHNVTTDSPEECFLCLADYLPIMPMLLYDLYINMDEFLKIDIIPAYTNYIKYLQLLSYQVGETGQNGAPEPKQWVLKCPIHMFYPKQLAKVWPNAKFIVTHRHPRYTVPSLCALMKSFHKMYYSSETLDAKALGRGVKHAVERSLQEFPRDVKETNLEMAELRYEDLIRDPVACVKKIYKQFNWDYSDEYDTDLKNYLLENKRSRHETFDSKVGLTAQYHEYNLEENFMTEEELCSGVCGDYAKKYNLSNDQIFLLPK